MTTTIIINTLFEHRDDLKLEKNYIALQKNLQSNLYQLKIIIIIK